jgi:hypothetical protein
MLLLMNIAPLSPPTAPPQPRPVAATIGRVIVTIMVSIGAVIGALASVILGWLSNLCFEGCPQHPSLVGPVIGFLVAIVIVILAIWAAVKIWSSE